MAEASAWRNLGYQHPACPVIITFSPEVILTSLHSLHVVMIICLSIPSSFLSTLSKHAKISTLDTYFVTKLVMVTALLKCSRGRPKYKMNL